jgi:hypothetical protein
MVAATGAGPAPISLKQLNIENLTEAILFCLSPHVSEIALQLSKKVQSESGVQSAVASFHANLPVEDVMRCDIIPHVAAAWTYKRNGIRLKLSKEVVGVLLRKHRIRLSDLKRQVFYLCAKLQARAISRSHRLQSIMVSFPAVT